VTENLYLGTSGFTAAGWLGTFFPKKLPAREYLSYYATRFNSVELMSTLYGPPAISTIKSWYSQTPKNFVFAIKMPRKITHEGALVDRSSDISDFFRVMDGLKEKLGPMFFKFSPKDAKLFGTPGNVLDRLLLLLNGLPKSYRFVVSLPAGWCAREVIDALRTRRVALALSDGNCPQESGFPEKSAKFMTSDFSYVRWVGEDKRMERRARVWDRIVVDRRDAILRWAEFISKNLLPKGRVFAYATNQYEGHAPSTAESLRRLLNGDNTENMGGEKSQATLFE
jgi:uncharacterized protein YecE (DUF72 family)